MEGVELLFISLMRGAWTETEIMGFPLVFPVLSEAADLTDSRATADPQRGESPSGEPSASLTSSHIDF